MRIAKFFAEWLDHDGKFVLIDGLKYRLSVKTYRARYPVERDVISVHAEPVNKRSKHYREVKRELGDDWSTDVLESSLELQADILSQLS